MTLTPREKNLAAIGEIAESYGFTVDDMIGKRKHKMLMKARRECVAMLRAKGLSTPQIGKIMNRDHSTIVHSLQVLEALK